MELKSMINSDRHLQIGSIIFEGLDQIDLTGPFEVLSRIPNSTYRVFGASTAPVKDARGLILTPDETYEQAPPLDVIHIPGGPGQEALMDDTGILNFIRKQAEHAEIVFSVCTGALLLGAAGLLRGRRATTHWGAFELLPLFGAEAVDERVVIDGKFVFAGGVTAGIDGALTVAAKLRGDAAAQQIQLYMQYAPEPPFDSGTPATAPAAVLEKARASGRELFERRLVTARKIAERLGISAAAGH
jgi:cyclohexyl-isocyanide hydratase